VLFSSTSACIGLARESDYASSNAYLDDIVHLRLMQACAGTHIAWGAVSKVGLAALVRQGSDEALLYPDTLCLPIAVCA